MGVILVIRKSVSATKNTYRWHISSTIYISFSSNEYNYLGPWLSGMTLRNMSILCRSRSSILCGPYSLPFFATLTTSDDEALIRRRRLIRGLDETTDDRPGRKSDVFDGDVASAEDG
jgi:hypothetical protein